MKYTFVKKQLKGLLAFALELFAKSENVYDFSDDGQAETVDALMAMIEARGLCADCGRPIAKMNDRSYCSCNIPFNGEPTTYDSNDTDPAEYGLQPEF